MNTATEAAAHKEEEGKEHLKKQKAFAHKLDINVIITAKQSQYGF
jgi:hypothetical protein